MYKHILIPLEHSPADKTILNHIRLLTEESKAELYLLHVADGWAARNFDALKLRESEEMKIDQAYLDTVAGELRTEGFQVETMLAKGDPASEIIKVASEKHIDLIAMSTHGHRFLADIIYGSTADKVRHSVDVPVLLLKAQSSTE